MENRPKLIIEITTADQILEILSWLVLLFLWGLVIYFYSNLPQIIPIHFNASGRANGFGSKGTLFLLPVIGTALFIGLTALNKVPHIFNYPTAITSENALKQYTNATRVLRFVKLIILIIFTEIVWATIATATGKANGLPSWFLPLEIGLTLITTIFFVYKSVRSK